MNREEARALLLEHKQWLDEPPMIQGTGRIQRISEALSMGTEALDRQIPQKPIKSEREIRYCEVWKCPSCGFEWSSRVVDYCYKCGQKIDWENL